MSIVSKALEYYDKNKEILNNKLKNVKYVRWTIYNDDTRRNKVKMYNKNKERLFEFEYEIIGLLNVIDEESSVWTWAWSAASLDKKSTNLSRKILDYGFNLEGDRNSFLKTELITSRFRITNQIQVDVHVSISSYLTKSDKIFRFIFPRNKENASESIEHVDYVPVIKEQDAGTKWEAFYIVLYDIDKS